MPVYRSERAVRGAHDHVREVLLLQLDRRRRGLCAVTVERELELVGRAEVHPVDFALWTIDGDHFPRFDKFFATAVVHFVRVREVLEGRRAHARREDVTREAEVGVEERLERKRRDRARWRVYREREVEPSRQELDRVLEREGEREERGDGRVRSES